MIINKNDYADDAEMQPLLDKEPAETLNEILAQVWLLKSLLKFIFCFHFLAYIA